MIPLLEIKTVPIEIQVKTQSASLEYTRGTAEMEISRSKQGSPEVKSRPIQIKQDTFEPRRSTYHPPIASQSSQSAAASGQNMSAGQGVYEVTSAYADAGQIALNVRMGHSMPAAPVVQNAAPAVQSDQSYTPPDLQPKAGVNVQWEDGNMEIRYNMDKLQFDWKIDRGEFKFTPGDIEISVETMPSITFTYTGGPIYVPRSSDPNYQPVNVEA